MFTFLESSHGKPRRKSLYKRINCGVIVFFNFKTPHKGDTNESLNVSADGITHTKNIALHCITLHCTVLQQTALHCRILHSLHCNALHYTKHHCTWYTALHCTINVNITITFGFLNYCLFKYCGICFCLRINFNIFFYSAFNYSPLSLYRP